MAKSSTSSFIHTLPLFAKSWQSDILDTRLDAGRQLYNAVLGEALRRRDLMMQSKTYQEARKLNRYAKKEKEGKREKALRAMARELFKEAATKHGFSEYDMHSYVKDIRNIQFSNLIDANTSQKIATRAFKAIHEYHFGGRGKPRFKKRGQFKSVEGKNNAAGIRFVDGKLSWNKLVIEIAYDQKDKHGIQTHALMADVKYCRIVRRTIRGERRFELQLVLKGAPKTKKKHIDARKGAAGKKVGIDLGPQTAAVVSKKESSLKILASDIDRTIKRKDELQRKLARKLRLANPHNYEPDRIVKKDKKVVKKLGKSKPKKECKTWIRTNSYKKLQNQISELERVQASRRKELHNRFINHLLTLGTEFKLEKLSYKAWQKMFGKSIGAKAPGLFVEQLRRKAENAGGSVSEIETRTTRLSQTCLCGTIRKKLLKERWHTCECGAHLQRDLLSAYLAMFVENNILDLKAANKGFPGIEHGLRSAILNLQDLNVSHLKLLGIKRAEIESPADLMSDKKFVVDTDAVAPSGARAVS